MVVLSSLVAALAGLAVQALAAPAANPVADFTAKFVDSGYIVKLKPSVAVDADQGHLSWVQGLHSRSLRKRDLPGLERQFNLTNFHGYSGRFDEATISEIKKSDDVSVSIPHGPGGGGGGRARKNKMETKRGRDARPPALSKVLAVQCRFSTSSRTRWSTSTSSTRSLQRS